ncbi:hypothetical protein TELCIR_05637 [Teladorsagia circumcincta]|uniref:Uncharacterized protein n=1 Tax=Teladorsagia circumcincta TaxID=45464 RepID=A0A2G9UQK7_TELCI|nr:hypothetical protein TELCIR_05637 [Teladorsagia circumcincta]
MNKFHVGILKAFACFAGNFGAVIEPMNPAPWKWLHNVVSKGSCDCGFWRMESQPVPLGAEARVIENPCGEIFVSSTHGLKCNALSSLITIGDGAGREEYGYLRITGRVNDLLDASSHLSSTADALVHNKELDKMPQEPSSLVPAPGRILVSKPMTEYEVYKLSVAGQEETTSLLSFTDFDFILTNFTGLLNFTDY